MTRSFDPGFDGGGTMLPRVLLSAVLTALAFLSPMAIRSAEAQAPAAPLDDAFRLLAVDDPERSLLRLEWIRDGGDGWGWRTPAVPLVEPAADLRLGGVERRGLLRFADGNPPGVPARPAPNLDGVSTVIRGWTPLGDRAAALAVDVRTVGTHLRARELSAGGALGPLLLVGGRTRVGLGPGEGGGLVLSGETPLDGLQVGLRQALRLPVVGSATGSFGVFRLDRNGPVDDPWLLAMRGSIRPHPAVVVGLNQGIMFANTPSSSISFAGFLDALVGGHANVIDAEGNEVNFANNVASLDVTVRRPVFGVPAAVYLEWGIEDSAGALRDSPGLVAGVEAVHPSRPARLGLEWSYLSPENGHGIWYSHSRFRGGWADGGGRPLGHPLAGPGRQWLLFGALHDPDGGWDVSVGLRRRHRLDTNAYAPQRAGVSWGGYTDARVRVGAAQLFIQVDGERLADDNGSGWTRTALEATAGLRWTYGGIR